MPEKDPLGDKLKDKERGEEEQYFSRRERALLDQLRGQERTAPEATRREKDPARCPKCNARLAMNVLDDIAAGTCLACR
jgi:hypothetical protein